MEIILTKEEQEFTADALKEGRCVNIHDVYRGKDVVLRIFPNKLR